MILKQAEKLKSREMKEGWMKNDDDFKLLRGFADGRTDICECSRFRDWK